MNKSKARIVGMLLVICLTISGCGTQQDSSQTLQGETTQSRAVPKAAPAAVGDVSIHDLARLYENDDPASVVTFYLTVRVGNAADGTNHTFEDVNSVLRLQGMNDVAVVAAEALLQEGDEQGPLPGGLGYGQVGANATIRIRGRTSTSYPQKSYRIDLFDSAGLWRGQRAIALNKHPADSTRLRNKLYFDLLKGVDHITTLRTQFVHLYVKDESAEPKQTEFVDFGLFTQVEIPNKRYLRNHELSVSGNLYKANMCEFFRYPEKLRLATDPLYNAKDFASVLESKTDEDHTKLLEMLDAVNNYSIPIEQTFEKYFDADNFFTFYAYNLLMSNPDSNAQNYLIYSPVNSSKWYFIPWDGDSSLRRLEHKLLNYQWEEGSWSWGASNYWSVLIYARVMRVERYRKMLSERVEELHLYLTPERMREQMAIYEPTLQRFLTVMPDRANLMTTLEMREKICSAMPNELELAYQSYRRSIAKPMPFYLAPVTMKDGALFFNWSEAYDFNGELVRYRIQVCKDWAFLPQDVIYESNGQFGLSATVPMPPAATYYWRVIATNERGLQQIPFDEILTRTGVHNGILSFTITDEGEVKNTQ
ncbi:MAG: CotH kinase family protein [Clostridia bacterium]